MIYRCPCCDERFEESFVCEICDRKIAGIPAARNEVRLGDGTIDDVFEFCQECVDRYDD